ncbi:MAG: MscS mechanosensitive ion channel, partial [Sphingomonadaceae bacterium]
TPKADAVILDVGDSNIVLRFFGWVDQTRTDFMKGRSLAIQAAKSALEEAGFALPEPIYRLRFDEAVPPALESLKSEPRVRAKTEAKIPPTGTAQDTAPDEHVVRLVKDERAYDPSTDLLDERRPIE